MVGKEAAPSESLTSGPAVDEKVASLSSRIEGSTAAVNTRNRDAFPNDNDADEDEDELFEELEKDDSLASLREERIEQLKEEMARIRSLCENEHGKYTEITDEKEVLNTTLKEERCVMHFYHRDFRRCRIMDSHLEALATRYFSTRFVKVLVENVPFLVDRLSIKVLPCVICFINGVTKDRITGFEELGNGDNFQTATLELRLRQTGVISVPQSKPKERTAYGGPSRIRGPSRDSDDDEYA